MPDILLDTQFNNPLLKTADVVVFKDTFNRADGVLSGQTTPIGGRTWSTRSDGSGANQTVVIRDNKAGILSDTAGSLLFGLVDVGTADGIYELDFVSATVINTAIFVPMRVATVNDFLQLTVTNGFWTLRKRLGSYIALGVSQVQAQPGQRLRIVLKGSSIKVYVNGQLALDVVDGDHATRTFFGIGNNSLAASTPAVLWDNISFTIPGS